MNQNNQENFNKLFEKQQNDSRLMAIGFILSGLASCLTAAALIYQVYQNKQKAKPSANVRKSRIDTTIAKLQLDKKQIDKEATYENERLKLETGLEGEVKPNSPLPNLDLLSNLKKQGTKLVEEKVNQFGEVAKEKISKVSETINKKVSFNKEVDDERK